ncbi:hypothetical protein L6452_14685 [Arctium lappa]|uniref:Uncharacterized protein n=1 Tax=Arctium lappa TaxID=4217 RepID=A0ACB9CLT6_ARCLA|nr:hypothetical protein L6452_14685 [Arctium lappa]
MVLLGFDEKKNRDAGDDDKSAFPQVPMMRSCCFRKRIETSGRVLSVLMFGLDDSRDFSCAWIRGSSVWGRFVASAQLFNWDRALVWRLSAVKVCLRVVARICKEQPRASVTRGIRLSFWGRLEFV